MATRIMHSARSRGLELICARFRLHDLSEPRSLASALTTARTSFERICSFCGLTAGGIARNHGENDPVADPDGLVVGHQVVHHIVTDPGDARTASGLSSAPTALVGGKEKHAEFGCVIDAARIDRPSCCTVG